MSVPAAHLFGGADSPAAAMMGPSQQEQQCFGYSYCWMCLETLQQHMHHPL